LEGLEEELKLTDADLIEDQQHLDEEYIAIRKALRGRRDLARARQILVEIKSMPPDDPRHGLFCERYGEALGGLKAWERRRSVAHDVSAPPSKTAYTDWVANSEPDYDSARSS
jgi:hypothetical protein